MPKPVPAVGSRVICEHKGRRRVGSVASLTPVPGGEVLLKVHFIRLGEYAYVPAGQTVPADYVDEFLYAVTGSL